MSCKHVGTDKRELKDSFDIERRKAILDKMIKVLYEVIKVLCKQVVLQFLVGFALGLGCVAGMFTGWELFR